MSAMEKTNAPDSVLLERADGIMTITINRPEVRNAIDMRTALALAAAIDELEGDPSLSVGILTGAGGTFCAGMDLRAFLRGERPRIEGRGFAGVVEAPPKKPFIAAVEGDALAGGFELVLSCDLVVASTEATFGLPEVKRGLVAVAGGLSRLPQWLPKPIALELALTGDRYSAPQLHAYGMINRLVEPGTALDNAKGLAGRIAANGPIALRATKQIALSSAGWPEDERFVRARAVAAEAFNSNDAQEGARAFAERRAPRWTAT